MYASRHMTQNISSRVVLEYHTIIWMNKETLDTGPATKDNNFSDKKFAASMEGNSALQSTTPKSKLKRNRTVLCVYCYQKPSIHVWWSTVHEDHCMHRSCQRAFTKFCFTIVYSMSSALACHKRKQQVRAALSIADQLW